MEKEFKGIIQPIIKDAVKEATQATVKAIKAENQKKYELDNPEYLSPYQVASMFNVTVTTVYRWEYKGSFKAYHVESRKRYLRSEILALAKELKKEPGKPK